MANNLENVFKTCLLKFEQYDYIIDKICIQFGINSEAMMKEAREAAQERLAAKLKDKTIPELLESL